MDETRIQLKDTWIKSNHQPGYSVVRHVWPRTRTWPARSILEPIGLFFHRRHQVIGSVWMLAWGQLIMMLSFGMHRKPPNGQGWPPEATDSQCVCVCACLNYSTTRRHVCQRWVSTREEQRLLGMYSPMIDNLSEIIDFYVLPTNGWRGVVSGFWQDFDTILG